MRCSNKRLHEFCLLSRRCSLDIFVGTGEVNEELESLDGDVGVSGDLTEDRTVSVLKSEVVNSSPEEPDPAGPGLDELEEEVHGESEVLGKEFSGDSDTPGDEDEENIHELLGHADVSVNTALEVGVGLRPHGLHRHILIITI